MCEEVHFSKFAGLQVYNWQLYYQKLATLLSTPSQVFFNSILNPYMLPPCIDLSPSHQILKRPPLFSAPVGNPEDILCYNCDCRCMLFFGHHHNCSEAYLMKVIRLKENNEFNVWLLWLYVYFSTGVVIFWLCMTLRERRS